MLMNGEGFVILFSFLLAWNGSNSKSGIYLTVFYKSSLFSFMYIHVYYSTVVFIFLLRTLGLTINIQQGALFCL